jgi:VanZ family protein
MRDIACPPRRLTDDRCRDCLRLQSAINLLLLSLTRNGLQLMPFLSKFKSPWIWKLALISYWVALYISTPLPTEVVSVAVSSSDKLIHVIAYAGLAMLLAIAWQLVMGPLTFRHLGLAWLALMIYGAFDEWTQIPVGREASVGDWLADALGAGIGLAIFACVVHFSQKRRSTDA